MMWGRAPAVRGRVRRRALAAWAALAVAWTPLPGPAGPAEAEASVAGCPVTVSCGFGCEASLTGGFCVTIVEFDSTGGVSTPFGKVKVGISVSLGCEICECWYVYTDSEGRSLFKRTTTLVCDGSIGGLDVIDPNLALE